MNSDLLIRVRHPTNKVPIMLDGIPASSDPESGPFLVTSSRGLLWVEKAFRGGFLRVATRRSDPHDIYREMVEIIAEEGMGRDWGNVFPPTREGLLEALARFHHYELPNPVLLYGENFDIGISDSVDRIPAEWVPEGWAVMVPDREYVGTLFEVGDKHVGAISHNASRGVVIIRPHSPA